MHQFLPSGDDVIAVIVGDTITTADYDAMIGRLETALASHERVHVYAETRSIDGIEVAGLGSRIARAMPMFGQLRRFGRVAVVADQAWVRAGSRVESALLPFVSYRVFPPAGREEALAWVLEG